MSAQVFSAEAFTELIELEAEGTAGLIEDLIADYEINCVRLRDAIDHSSRILDLKVLERSAHSLKSSSRLLGLEVLAEVAYVIEDGARRGSVRVDEVARVPLYLETALVELRRFRDSRRNAV